MNFLVQELPNLLTLAFWIHLCFDVSVAQTITSSGGQLVLTSGDCGSGAHFDVRHKGIQVVSQDAFLSCKSATHINLGENNIHDLPENTFRENGKLQELRLHCNKLTFIPKRLLAPLVNLVLLDVCANEYKSFDFVYQHHFPQFKFLSAMYNELTDMDAGRILKSMPKLHNIHFAYNPIECEKYEKIKQDFQARNVVVIESLYGCGKHALNGAKRCLEFDEQCDEAKKNVVQFGDDAKRVENQLRELEVCHISDVKNLTSFIRNSFEETKKNIGKTQISVQDVENELQKLNSLCVVDIQYCNESLEILDEKQSLSNTMVENLNVKVLGLFYALIVLAVLIVLINIAIFYKILVQDNTLKKLSAKCGSNPDVASYVDPPIYENEY